VGVAHTFSGVGGGGATPPSCPALFAVF